MLAAPPAAAATESTIRICLVRGGLPASSSRPASPPMATIVPMVSKKSASMIEKTSSTTATMPIFSIEPKSEKWPISEKSGILANDSGIFGTTRPHPVGLSADFSPMVAMASMMTARTVAEAIAIRIAPRTLRTSRIAIRNRPTTNTRIGQPAVDAEAENRYARTDDAGVDQADQGDEQADAHTDRHLELLGHRPEDRLAEAGEHKDEDDQTLEDDDAHRVRPRHAIEAGDGVCDEGVESESGRQGQRELRDDAHRDGQQAGHEGGHRGDLGEVATGERVPRTVGDGADDERVEDDDVAHREEGDQAAADLGPDGRATSGDLEVGVEASDWTRLLGGRGGGGLRHGAQSARSNGR